MACNVTIQKDENNYELTIGAITIYPSFSWSELHNLNKLINAALACQGDFISKDISDVD